MPQSGDAVRIGVVARCDDRGIGIQTWEMVRELPADAVLVVREPGAEARGFRPHLDRYPGAPVVTFDPRTGALPEAETRAFFESVDVAYMVETPYDFRAFQWARDAGCATVVHANPEFWRWHAGDVDRPTGWWLPTNWLADQLDPDCRIVPMPVPTPPRLDTPQPAEVLRLVHVVGHRAAADRNGTVALFQATRKIKAHVRLRVECQDPRLPTPVGARTNVIYRRRLGGLEDRWQLYEDADVLVLPRRYGGLCLPVLEAMAVGLVVVMSDVEPQRSSWPIVPVPVQRTRRMHTVGGMIRLADVRAADLAVAIDRLDGNRSAFELHRRRTIQWAADHSWPALRPRLLNELARLCGQ